MGRVLSRREFVITDAHALELVRATTHWAFMDRRVKRVARVPAEVASAYPVDAERALPLSFGRPAPCDRPAWESRFPVGHRDIDSNHHVNNLRYLEWMIETLPPEIPARWTLHEINIRFQQETPPGGSVRTEVQELPCPTQGPDSALPVRRFALQVINASGGVAASAEMHWQGPA
jgi:acyl-ACP thioesterase